MMRKVIFLLALFTSLPLLAEAPRVVMEPIVVDIQDKAALQRGAKLFMNYCSGCHALRYMRYNRMGNDLGLTTFDGRLDTDLLVNNLIFTHARPEDPIQISMPEEDARQWFGKMPPDLSLSARERGVSWLYTYLKSFYEDKKRPFGANNLLIPDVAMPNILEPLQGKVVALKPNDLEQRPMNANLALVKSGEMSQAAFDRAVHDLVTFLAYVGEPAQLSRYRLGYKVILFLAVFLAFAYALKRSYWRRIH